MPITKLDILRSRLQNKARKMREDPRFIMHNPRHAWSYVIHLKQFERAIICRSHEEVMSLKQSFEATYERK